ncbi:MAG: hypothetical protein QW594_00865 [Candidatus Woesearchaeota archaeon]
MEWNSIPKDIKIIIIFSSIFIVVALSFFSSRYLFAQEQQEPKTYVFHESMTITTTTTTERQIAPIICSHVARRNDCHNLEKFALSIQECCTYGYCCENHESTRSPN